MDRWKLNCPKYKKINIQRFAERKKKVSIGKILPYQLSFSYSGSSMVLTGPMNHLWAEMIQEAVAKMNTPIMITTA
jgi:hypothetical protein